MDESEMISKIKQIVRNELAQIMMCQIVSTDNSQTASVTRFATDNQTDNLRLIQPYGVASRPPTGMDSVLTPVNSDPSHLNITGQYDSNRPAMNPGEVCLYGPQGQVLYFNNAGETHLGSETSNQPLVLGTEIKSWATNLISAILNITYIGNLGAPITGTLNETDFNNLVDQLVTIVSTKIFAE